MIVSTSLALLLCAVLTVGLAWPVVARLPLEPAEKLVATIAVSWLGLFLAAWAGFALHAPVTWHWVLPAAAVAGAWFRRRELATMGRDSVTRELLLGQVVVSAWCLGWLALVTTYSGGGWAADWYEHWERTRFFLERGAPETVFIDHAGVTARPPLANVVIGVFLSLTRPDFAHYQIFSTVLGSLAFAPLALWARHWGGRPAIPVAAIVLMLNPLFVQNATFAWTKLPAAFFLLTAAWFLPRALDPNAPATPRLLFSAGLAAALLTHYSAGPYALVFAGIWLAATWLRRRDGAWLRATLVTGAVGAGVLATWFGWAFAVFGAGGTLLANTSVQTADTSAAGQLIRIGLNLRDTFVPHFARTLDGSLIAQTSPWGQWRDWFFQLYQVNAIFALGSAGGLVLAVALAQRWPAACPRVRHTWLAALATIVVLGIAVHGARDTWGLAHICLQPVVLLGLAFLAGRARHLAPRWRLLLVSGAACDLSLGICLHFGVQNLAFDRWLTPGRSYDEIFASYSRVAYMNIAAKVQHQLVFFADALAASRPLIFGALAASLALALWRCRRSA